MRQKILIAIESETERRELEEILEEVVDQGGELFSAPNRDVALQVLSQEKPQLVLLDATLVGKDEDEWVRDGVHVTVVRAADEREQKSEDFMLKPFIREQVLEKCREALGPMAISDPLPPM